jgi:hypothetical protein
MAEHPIVTVTPAQYHELEPFFAYELTADLNRELVAFAATLLEQALGLVVLELTPQRAEALKDLEAASVWRQQALIRAKGIAHPPSWLHVK